MSKLLLLVLFIFGATSLSGSEYPDDLVGHWAFNNPDSLTEASIGNNLILTGIILLLRDQVIQLEQLELVLVVFIQLYMIFLQMVVVA